jgi:hypothetical protein
VVEIHPLPFAQSKRLLQMMLNIHNDTYGMADNPAFCCEYGFGYKAINKTENLISHSHLTDIEAQNSFHVGGQLN